jgi:AcrR family transcriptional regulator
MRSGSLCIIGHMGAEPRALRADAERNRRRILDAARKVFADQGLGAGVDAIARMAGVGVGTLYRRFPTKQELLVAVIDDGIARLACEVEELHAVDDPWEAFTTALHSFAGTIARDRGFFEVIHGNPEFVPVARDAKQRLMAAFDVLLRRAQEAGTVRRDVVVDDVGALCMVAARLPSWRLDRQPELWTRYLALLMDGLRPEGARELEHPPPLPVPERLPRQRRKRA